MKNRTFVVALLLAVLAGIPLLAQRQESVWRRYFPLETRRTFFDDRRLLNGNPQVGWAIFGVPPEIVNVNGRDTFVPAEKLGKQRYALMSLGFNGVGSPVSPPLYKDSVEKPGFWFECTRDGFAVQVNTGVFAIWWVKEQVEPETGLESWRRSQRLFDSRNTPRREERFVLTINRGQSEIIAAPVQQDYFDMLRIFDTFATGYAFQWALDVNHDLFLYELSQTNGGFHIHHREFKYDLGFHTNAGSSPLKPLATEYVKLCNRLKK